MIICRSGVCNEFQTIVTMLRIGGLPDIIYSKSQWRKLVIMLLGWGRPTMVLFPSLSKNPTSSMVGLGFKVPRFPRVSHGEGELVGHHQLITIAISAIAPHTFGHLWTFCGWMVIGKWMFTHLRELSYQAQKLTRWDLLNEDSFLFLPYKINDFYPELPFCIELDNPMKLVT